MKNPDNQKIEKTKNLSHLGYYVKTAVMALSMALSLNSCNPPNKKTIIVEKGQNLTQIVRDSIINQNDELSEEEKSNWLLTQDIINEIAEENDIEDMNVISVGDTLVLDMNAINKIIKQYHKKTEKDNKDQKEKTDEDKYITIHSIDEFKKSDNYLIQKIYKDKNINGKFIEALNNGYSIKFPNSRETKKSPSLSVDEITKPKEIVGNELKGKKFVLDPGHGSMDVGAVGLAQYGDESNKEKVVVYESAIMMDLTYRIARELRAHGAEVVLTHHMNKRGILDIKDLPPCSRVFDKDGNELFQDIWNGVDKNSDGNLFNADGQYLTKRARIANQNNPDLFVSYHADIVLKNGNEIDDQIKILSFKYDERQNNPESKKIARQLLDNGTRYYYNGKLAGDVKRDVSSQYLGVLKPTTAPAILIETGNISNENQAYILREPSNRQKFAENFVSALIKTYNKNQHSIKNNESTNNQNQHSIKSRGNMHKPLNNNFNKNPKGTTGRIFQRKT